MFVLLTSDEHIGKNIKEEKMQLDHENEKHDMNICFKKFEIINRVPYTTME